MLPEKKRLSEIATSRSIGSREFRDRIAGTVMQEKKVLYSRLSNGKKFR